MGNDNSNEILAEKIQVANHRIDDLEAANKDRGSRLGTVERKQTETEQAFLYLKEQQEQTTREIKDLRDLTLSVRDLTLCVNSMKEDVDEVKAAVREQSKRPSMWLDKIIWAVLGGGIAALVTFLMTGML